MCDKFLSPQVAQFVKTEVELYKKSGHGRRYSNSCKEFALSVYFLSPKCYRFLQRMFCLPSYRSICRFVETVKFSPGINENLFQLLKIKVSKMNELDKVCVLCLGEMSIKANLYYNISRDEIVGFEDNGENKTLKPASSATVFMVRGLKANWKQAIAYLFSQTNYSVQDMLFLINKIVKWLSFIGLDVVCLITDMGSNCIELSKVLGVTSENTKIVVGQK